MARKQNRILPMESATIKQRSGGKLWLWLAVLLCIGLVVAWVDGGEEPLRPMSERVTAPE